MKLNKYIAATVMLLCASCVADNEEFDNSLDDGFLRFDVSVDGKSTSTKSEIISPSNLDKFTKFGIYALNIDGCFFEDKEVVLNPNNDTWCSSESLPSWNYGETLIYGYAPYQSSSVKTSVNEENCLVIDYVHEPLAEDQVDLMISFPVFTNSNSGIDMDFVHTMSAIAFNVKGFGNAEIKKIGFKGCYGKGKIVIDGDGDGDWSDCVVDTETNYQMRLYDNNIPTVQNPISTAADGEYLMMIPSNDLSDVEFVALIGDVRTGEESVIALSLPTTEVWQHGNIYTYNVMIDELNAISFSNEVTVESWSDVDENDHDYSANQESAASEIANCYMLNSALADKTFYIPVSERIEEFWGGYEGKTGLDLRDYTLNFGDEWTASYMWCGGDFTAENITEMVIEPLNTGEQIDAVGRNERVTASKCTNNFMTLESRAAMKITLPASVEEGNVVIGVYKTINEVKTLLWSWHLWVTKYNPNTVEPTSVGGSLNDFSVGNGNVQRYNDSAEQSPAIWGAGGIYDGKYIMDRNIGSYGVNRTMGASGEVLLYQFGRKDPYPAYTEGSATSAYYVPKVILNSGVSQYYTSSTGELMTESVKYPIKRYYVYSTTNVAKYSWCDDEAVFNDKCLWNDQDVDNDIYADKTVGQKSMFDPSPLGWKIPISEVWNGFPTDIKQGDWSNTDPSNDLYFHTVARSGEDGDPVNGLMFTLDGFAKFPSVGFMPYSHRYGYAPTYGFYDTYSTSSTYYTYLWSASSDIRPTASTSYTPKGKAYYMKCYGSGYGTSTSTGYGGLAELNRSSSLSIRCIQE